MTSVFVIVRKESKVVGHGERAEFVNVAMVDPYDTSSSHPALHQKKKQIHISLHYQRTGLSG